MIGEYEREEEVELSDGMREFESASDFARRLVGVFLQYFSEPS